MPPLPDPAAPPLVALHDVVRAYPRGAAQVLALAGVSLEIQTGEKLAIMGPSASGKTTLLSILGCLDRPTRVQHFFEGSSVAVLDDDELSRLRNRSVGFVFQNDHRHQIADLEREFDIRIEIVAATALHRSQEKIEWFDRDHEHEAPAPAKAAVTVADLASGAGGAAPRRGETGREPDEEEADDDVGAPAAGESEKAKRRRRGGRRRKKGATASESPAEPAALAADAESTPGDALVAGAAGGPPAGETEKAKRRRRGGRRHKKGAAAGEVPAEPAPAGCHDAAAPTADATKATRWRLT